MTTPDVASAYDELSGRYDHHHIDAKSLAENRYISPFLTEQIRPGMKVVDLGCGTGLLLELCQVSDRDYFGLDISEGMLAQGKSKFPRHRFAVGDMQKRNEIVPDGTADLVVSLFGSVSYCEIEKVRTEIWRMLKPGGRYFLMFCSPLYVNRETYITRSSSLLKPYNHKQIEAVFRPDSVWGMSRWVDRLPKRTPAPLMNTILALEIATLGKSRPDSCFFVNAWGTKRD